MSGVEIYTKQSCMFCQKAKAWFTENGIPYQEHDCSTVDGFTAMQDRVPGAKTVPQILIDGHLIGGYDTLKAHEEPILAKLRETYPA